MAGGVAGCIVSAFRKVSTSLSASLQLRARHLAQFLEQNLQKK